MDGRNKPGHDDNVNHASSWNRSGAACCRTLLLPALADIAVAIGRASRVPSGQCAVVLKPQKSPGELDHPAADPGIAGFTQALAALGRAADEMTFAGRAAARRQ